MTYKQLETSREIRLWITQIIVPTAIAAGLYFSVPENRDKAKRTFNKIANKFRRKNETHKTEN